MKHLNAVEQQLDADGAFIGLGIVNVCSLLNPGFETLGSGNRVKHRDMLTVRQMRICLCLLHVPFTCILPHKPFGLSFDQQIEERSVTGSHKED